MWSFAQGYILNGKELSENGVLSEIRDINGTTLDTVRMFDERLDPYALELIDTLKIWKKSTLEMRLEAISSIKKNLENEHLADKLVKSICAEIGKPLIEAETEISEAIDLIDYFLRNVSEEIYCSKVEVDSYYKTKSNYIKLSPLGIVGIIKPWNYPITNSLWSIIPALLAGNVVIYKPSEHCCNTAKILADVIMDSQLPNGVFNILFGNWRTGQRITECRKVSMISFTGSSDTAVTIQKHSLDHGIIRKYSIESGGSDFAIIDKNVNIDFATDGVIWGAFNNAGQVCTSIENVIIPIEIYSSVVKLLEKKLLTLKAGRDYGKIQNSDLKNKVTEYLNKIRIDNTASILSGGVIENDFLIPTLITDSNLESINTELFSNIIRVFSYSDELELLNVVNSSNYGLGCTIWTEEPQSERINHLIDEIDVGMIWINDVNIAFPEMPWTGVKNSGVGFNLSLDSIKEFSSLKSISIDTNTIERKEWWYPYED